MQTKTIIRFGANAWRAITAHHRNKGSFERASVALGHQVSYGDRQVIIVGPAGVVPVLDSDCLRQSGGNVQVNPDVTRRLMWWLAQSDFNTFLSIHDHWFSSAGTTFSGGDNRDDLIQDRYFREALEPQLRLGKFGSPRNISHLAMVLDQTTFDARTVSGGASFGQVDALRVVGAQLENLVPNSMRRSTKAGGRDEETLARHRDFISPATQSLISTLRVGIIGCGGVGPIVAENLMRLGVREFALFDPDTLEMSNLNRWLGGSSLDIGDKKVALLARHLKHCDPTLRVEEHCVDIIDAQPTNAMATCDILIAAVDNDAARFWLNRVAAAMMIPLLDLGVRVRTSPRTDFMTRIVSVVPGVTACLECSPLALLDRVAISERFDGLTASMRRAEGYVSGQDIAAPSVMGLNTQVAGSATLELISYFSGWQDHPAIKTTTWSTGRTVSIQAADHQPAADCPACGMHNLARGPFGDIPRPASASESIEVLRELLFPQPDNEVTSRV